MAASVMTLAQMRDFVRDSLDTDSIDLPDALVDRWIVDGSNRVNSHSRSWTFRAVDYTFTTVADTQSYDIRSDVRLPGITYPLASLTDVRGPNFTMVPRDHQEMRSNYSADSTSTGTPNAFTIWGDLIYLWPTPSDAIDVSVTGYREVIEWVDTALAPDFPADFHELIAWWALNRGYAWDGDPQMADFYRQEFSVALHDRARKWTPGVSTAPLILNGGNADEGWRTSSVLGPLIYDWE